MPFTIHGDEFIKQEKDGKYRCYRHHCYLFYVARRGGRGGGVNLRCVDCVNGVEPWPKSTPERDEKK